MDQCLNVRPAGAARSTPVSRRGFLATATSLAALPAVWPAVEPPSWQIGCYTRPWDEHEYRVALDSIAEAGYRYAGLMTGKGATWVLVTDRTTPAQAAEMGREVSARGLALVSIYGDYALEDSPEKSVDRLRRLIDRCAECGSPSLLLGGTTEPDQVEPYFAAVANCCAFAAGRGIGLCIKPHGGQNASGAECRALIERVNHPNFRLWYDPGNIFYYSDGQLDPVDDATRVDGLVAGMSVKDFLPPKNVDVTPGNGRVAFPHVLERLRAGGFTRGPLVVECLARGDVRFITAEARAARERLEAWIRTMASTGATG